MLSTVNDGEFQRVFVNVSPVKKDVIDRFPETVAFAWRLDGMTLNGEDYWMTAGPKLKSGTSVSGYEAIREAVYRDAYDEETETLTRSGNIGVTTTQQMLTSERDLWKWNFFDQIFADLDRELALMFHDPCRVVI